MNLAHATPAIEAESELYVLIVSHLVPYEKVRAHSSGHVAYLDSFQAAGVFLASGQADVSQDGGVILARAIGRDAIEDVIRQDPYVREGVSEYRIVAIRRRAEPNAQPPAGT
jgi:uncharacterized protein YciI